MGCHFLRAISWGGGGRRKKVLSPLFSALYNETLPMLKASPPPSPALMDLPLSGRGGLGDSHAGVLVVAIVAHCATEPCNIFQYFVEANIWFFFRHCVLHFFLFLHQCLYMTRGAKWTLKTLHNVLQIEPELTDWFLGPANVCLNCLPGVDARPATVACKMEAQLERAHVAHTFLHVLRRFVCSISAC